MAHSIHKRFAIALLREALAGAGTLHVNYRVDNEPEWVEVWEPRRSANDPSPPAPPHPDPYKRFARSILGAAMEHAGMVPVAFRIGTEPDWIDLYFEPDPSGVAAPGLLGRMTRSSCVLFPFHLPPDEHELHDVMSLSLNLWAMKGREAKKARVKSPDVPASWLISTEPTDALLDGLGLKRKRNWPRGTYIGPPAFAVKAVVLRELALTRDTLLLRLMGTGDVLTRALAEQAALPADSPERRAARAALLAACAQDEPIPIDEATAQPILHACRRAYQRWLKANR